MALASDALRVRDERLSHGDCCLYGTLIGYYGSILLRASIKRDGYDNQCEARVDTWGRDGWTLVQWVPICDLPIAAFSYVHKPERWHGPMQASLLALCQLGRRILVKEEG
jgi:hypothetical protein